MPNHNLDRRPVVELVLSCRHHDIARLDSIEHRNLDSIEHRNLVATRLASLHEHLLRNHLLPSARAFFRIFNHVGDVAI